VKSTLARCLQILPIAIAGFVARPAAAAVPIDFTVHSWQWFGNGPGSPKPLSDYNPVCMDGSDTGIGVYVPTGWNGKVLYWFDGGGYCFDNTSCNSNPAVNGFSIATDFVNGVVPLAPFVFRKSFSYNDFNTTYVNGTGGFDLNLMVQQKPVLGQGIFDHTAGTTNPFVNYLEVFIPYCTGDAHVGSKNDNTPSSFARVPSNINFRGLSNSKNAVNYTNLAITQQRAGSPTPLAVISGGSAGGVASVLLYGALRAILSPSTKMITIDDGGTIYATGVPNSTGTAWNQQGYLGFPTYFLSTNKFRPGCFQYPSPFTAQCTSPATVTYQEAFMDDAWGTSFASSYPPAFVSASTPAGSPAPFVSNQSILAYEVNQVHNGDAFHLIDSNNDFADTWFFSMYPNGQFPFGYTGTADVAHGQAQILSAFGTTLWQVTLNGSGVGTWAGAIPWNEHHGFLLDDTSTWDSGATGPGGGVGSGVKQFLSSIQPPGGWN
jgi:hypothetical protein